MPERTSWGDYSEPGNEHARSGWLLMKAVHDHARDVLDAVGVALLPTVRAAMESPRYWEAHELVEACWGSAFDLVEASAVVARVHRVSPTASITRSDHWHKTVTGAVEVARDLERACRAAVPVGLQAKWLVRRLLEGVREWVWDPAAEAERRWTYPEYEGPLSNEDTTVAVNLSWRVDPFSGSVRDAEEAMVEQVRAAIREQVRRVEEAAAVVGTQTTKAKRDADHYFWLVLRNVRLWSPAKIGREVNAAKGTVEQALTRLRNALHLPAVDAEVHAGSPGAPRGSRKKVKETRHPPV